MRRPIACLVVAGLGLPVGALYWLGVAVVALLLAYEHSLVRPGDLRRLDAAFFTMNGVISVVFAAFVILDAVAVSAYPGRVLTASRLGKRFGDKRVLRGVDLDAARAAASPSSPARTAPARRRCCASAPVSRMPTEGDARPST